MFSHDARVVVPGAAPTPQQAVSPELHLRRDRPGACGGLGPVGVRQATRRADRRAHPWRPRSVRPSRAHPAGLPSDHRAGPRIPPQAPQPALRSASRPRQAWSEQREAHLPKPIFASYLYGGSHLAADARHRAPRQRGLVDSEASHGRRAAANAERDAEPEPSRPQVARRQARGRGLTAVLQQAGTHTEPHPRLGRPGPCGGLGPAGVRQETRRADRRAHPWRPRSVRPSGAHPAGLSSDRRAGPRNSPPAPSLPGGVLRG